MVGMLRGASANLLFINPVFEATVKIHKGKWSKDQGGGIIPSGNFPAQALCGTPCGKNLVCRF